MLALARPFKKHSYNITDTFILMAIAILYVTVFPFTFYHSHTTEMGLFPAAYFFLIVTYTIVLFPLLSKPCGLVVKCSHKLHQMMKRKEECLTSFSQND